MKIYPNCIICNKELEPEEKEKNELHNNYLHPMCNTCLSGVTKDIVKVFDKRG